MSLPLDVAPSSRLAIFMPPKLPPKKDVANALLEGPSVFVHLDPRKDEVSVPQWFKKQFQLVLQVGMNMAVPIPDLDVGDEGISCTLSFNRSPFWCFLPWSAVYMLVGEDGRGMIWPEDVPPELTIAQNKPKLQVVDNKKSAKRPAPKLTAVDAADAETEDVPADELPGGAEPAAKKDAGRGRLAAVPNEPRAPTKLAAVKAEPDATGSEAAEAEPDTIESGSVDSSSVDSGSVDSSSADSEGAETSEAAPKGADVVSSDDGDDADDGDDGGRKLPPYLRVIK